MQPCYYSQPFRQEHLAIQSDLDLGLDIDLDLDLDLDLVRSILY